MIRELFFILENNIFYFILEKNNLFYFREQ